MSDRICPNCLKVLQLSEHGHYAPPSMGAAGFFVCNKAMTPEKRNLTPDEERKAVEKAVAEEYPIDLWPTVKRMTAIRDALVTARLRIREIEAELAEAKVREKNLIGEVEKLRVDSEAADYYVKTLDALSDEFEAVKSQLSALKESQEKGLREAFIAGYWRIPTGDPDGPTAEQVAAEHVAAFLKREKI